MNISEIFCEHHDNKEYTVIVEVEGRKYILKNIGDSKRFEYALKDFGKDYTRETGKKLDNVDRLIIEKRDHVMDRWIESDL